jgi:MFS family permease
MMLRQTKKQSGKAALIIPQKPMIMGWVICTLAALFYCYEYLLRIEPSVMVPELMHAFQANATELGTLSAFYYFIYVPMQIAVGMLLDLYGPRKILTIAIIACAMGSSIFGAAHALPIAAVGRLLIGFGSAFAFVAVLKLTTTWLPQRFFTFFVGLATALGMLGAMIGDIVLSSLVNNIGWKQTVHIGTVIGIILIPLIWLIIRDKPQTKTHKKEKIKRKLPYRATALGLLKIFKKPQMWINGFIGCILYLSLSSFAELWGIPFLRHVHHLPKQSAATACSMVFLGWLIGGPIVGYVSDLFYSRRTPLLIGFSSSAILISLIIYLPQINISLLHLLLLLFGAFSSFEVLCFAISRESCPKRLVATASAFTNSLIMLSGIVFQPLIGKILDWFWTGQTLHGDRVYSANSYQYALTILPLSFLLGFILTFWLKEKRNKKRT